jgi:hypothetical protein
MQTQSKKTTPEEYLQPWTASKYLFEITILKPNMVHRLNDIKELLKQQNTVVDRIPARITLK